MNTVQLFFVLCCAVFQRGAAYNNSDFELSSAGENTDGNVFQDDVSIIHQGPGEIRARNLIDTLKQNGGDISQSVAHGSKVETFIKDILQGNVNSKKIISNTVILLTKAISLIFADITTSSRCANDTKRLLDGIVSRENWTIPFLDSSSKPGPSITLGWLNLVGNYDQCNDAEAPPSGMAENTSFKGEYCVISTYVPGVAGIPTKMGLCVPDTCSDLDATIIATQVIRKLHLNITSVNAEMYSGKTKVTTATVIAIIMLTVTGVLAILGTVYDLFIVNKLFDDNTTPASLDHKSAENGFIGSKPVFNNYESISDESKSDPKTTTGYVDQILLSFSFYTNGKKVLAVSKSSDSLQALNGIRYLSICWVILGHVYIYGREYTMNSMSEFPKLLDRWTFCVVANGYASVDTFFTLSGLLTSYLTFMKMKKSGWNINWPKWYFHRFWRLTPPYMAILVFSLGLMQYFGDGPLWPNEEPTNKELCEDNWWKNLLYINNFQPLRKICMGHSWYLGNDMQFFLLSPIMLIPLYFHRVAGILCCLVLLMVSWIVTGVLSTVNDWAITGISMTGTVEELNEWSDDYYVKPWCRIGPFIVGVLAGYLLAHIKGKSLTMKWWVVALGWLLAIGSGLSVVYGLHGDISGKHPSRNEVRALYNAVARTVWGASICWVIVACEAGYGGPVNAFLSWSPFVVLGRLTYMTYLIHPTIIGVFYKNMGSTVFINDTTMAIYFTGILTFSSFAAFFAMMCFESPMIGLEKIFLPQKKHP